MICCEALAIVSMQPSAKLLLGHRADIIPLTRCLSLHSTTYTQSMRDRIREGTNTVMHPSSVPITPNFPTIRFDHSAATRALIACKIAGDSTSELVKMPRAMTDPILGTCLHAPDLA